MDGNAKPLTLGGDLDSVGQREIRISGKGDQLVGESAALACGEFWNRVPLFRRRRQTDLAVRGDALAMQDDLNSSHLLIAEHLVKLILVGENAEALGFETILLAQTQVGCRKRTATTRGQKNEDDFATHERLEWADSATIRTQPPRDL